MRDKKIFTYIYIFHFLVSDTCIDDPSKDLTGPALIQLVTNLETETGKILKGQISQKAIVPDDKHEIEVSVSSEEVTCFFFSVEKDLNRI